jgi:hypothetical protein
MSGTERISIILEGEQFGRFQGARVENILSGSEHTPAELEAAQKQLESRMAQLIRNDDILYVEPGHTPDVSELFKSVMRPYFAMVTWKDGQMHIERVPIMT